MCTVTFIPATDGKIFITHNRDEKCVRAKAVPPQHYRINENDLLFPKDSQAGGSWIAVNEFGSACVLLNGGFVKHIPSPPYRKSRGLIFLELAASADIYNAYNQIDLNNIEPFTVILWNNKDLYECRWDAEKKYVKKLDASVPHIWSSVTLYDEAVRRKRSEWFERWLAENPILSLENIIHFHLFGGEGDQHNDLRMNRDGTMLTVSITGMEIMTSCARISYHDLQDNTIYKQEMEFIEINERT